MTGQITNRSFTDHSKYVLYRRSRLILCTEQKTGQLSQPITSACFGGIKLT